MEPHGKQLLRLRADIRRRFFQFDRVRLAVCLEPPIPWSILQSLRFGSETFSGEPGMVSVSGFNAFATEQVCR